MSTASFRQTAPALAAHAALGLQLLLLSYAVGRPLFTDDLWWHLVLGEAFLADGPWLVADPKLHTAAGPPDSASWLFDAALFLVLEAGGLNGLRVVHVLLVVAILAGAWKLLRRASGSRLLASLGTASFAALAAYRLFQLRSELASMLVLLALYALLLEGGRVPGRRRIVLAALLTAVWANVHAAFVLGPVLLGVAAIGVVASLPLEAQARRAASRLRASRLAVAVGVCSFAGLANPKGYGAYLPYLRSGDSTPDVGLIFDEWAPFSPFQLPAFDTQPTLLTFFLIWVLLLLTPLVCSRLAWRRFFVSTGKPPLPWDPALLAVSAATLVAALIAVRFLWLGIFPLLFVCDTLQRNASELPFWKRTLGVWALSGAVGLVVLGFFRAGDWPFISRGIPTRWEAYREPYADRKYHAHAAWFLDEAGLSGNLYNAYHQGGFLSFWLSRDLKTFVDGSLNVGPDVMRAYEALQMRRGVFAGESFLETLDRYGIDLFVGIGVPSLQHPNRPWRYTTAYLEGAEGWLPIFRSARSAVYLRNSPANAENLRRVARYYERVGVPFDSTQGLDPADVLSTQPRWGLRFGLIPRDFWQMSREQFSPAPGTARRARDRLSATFAMLGLYDRMARVEARTLAIDPEAGVARRRRVWALLRAGRFPEAEIELKTLVETEALDSVSSLLAYSLRELERLPNPEMRWALVAKLPAFTRDEARHFASGYQAPDRGERRMGEIEGGTGPPPDDGTTPKAP